MWLDRGVTGWQYEAGPAPFGVEGFWVVLIRVLTKKPYQTQKGTTFEGLGRLQNQAMQST